MPDEPHPRIRGHERTERQPSGLADAGEPVDPRHEDDMTSRDDDPDDLERVEPTVEWIDDDGSDQEAAR